MRKLVTFIVALGVVVFVSSAARANECWVYDEDSPAHRLSQCMCEVYVEWHRCSQRCSVGDFTCEHACSDEYNTGKESCYRHGDHGNQDHDGSGTPPDDAPAGGGGVPPVPGGDTGGDTGGTGDGTGRSGKGPDSHPANRLVIDYLAPTGIFAAKLSLAVEMMWSGVTMAFGRAAIASVSAGLGLSRGTADTVTIDITFGELSGGASSAVGLKRIDPVFLVETRSFTRDLALGPYVRSEMLADRLLAEKAFQIELRQTRYQILHQNVARGVPHAQEMLTFFENENLARIAQHRLEMQYIPTTQPPASTVYWLKWLRRNLIN